MTVRESDDGDINDLIGLPPIVSAIPVRYILSPFWGGNEKAFATKKRSYIQNMNIYHKTGTLQNFISPEKNIWKRANYALSEKSSWNSLDFLSCSSEVILESDSDFGLKMIKNHQGKDEPYPLDPENFFRDGFKTKFDRQKCK